MNANKYIDVDLTGKKHHLLTAIRKTDYGKTQWIVKCECGTTKILSAHKFYEYKSCGCLEKENKEKLGKHNITHGMTETRLYRVWTGMKDRCYNSNASQYKWYGGRGIGVCQEWKESFEAFKMWAEKSGYESSKDGNVQSIDRIDVDKDYCPDNCRWISHKEQMNNTTRNSYLIHDGERMSVSAFCERYGITYQKFVARRLKRNVPSDIILKEWEFSKGTHIGYYDMEEAEKVYKKCSQTIKCWIDKGWIKAEKIGSHWYIPIGQPFPTLAVPTEA